MAKSLEDKKTTKASSNSSNGVKATRSNATESEKVIKEHERKKSNAKVVELIAFPHAFSREDSGILVGFEIRDYSHHAKVELAASFFNRGDWMPNKGISYDVIGNFRNTTGAMFKPNAKGDQIIIRQLIKPPSDATQAYVIVNTDGGSKKAEWVTLR